jgi:hypothetical protein
MSLSDLSKLSDSARTTYDTLSPKYGPNAPRESLNPNPALNNLTHAERSEYNGLRLQMQNAGFDTNFTDQDSKRLQELTAKLGPKGGRSKSSKKRPTIRRRRSSKARKSRKARSTRRR